MGAKTKCLLDVDAVREAILATGVDAQKAEGHAKRLVHRVFQHEKFKVHRQLVADFAEGPNEPIEKRLAAPVHNEFDVKDQSDLPRGVYEALEGWSVLTSKVVHASESSDYVTTKLLIELETGNQVEAVILRHNKRTTLCVSSQVGCKMGCTFCATGTLGQRANLTAGEIQEQLVHANRFLKCAKEPRDVSNVVFMGMGEPLNNYKALVAACRAMVDSSLFSLSPGKVTVSTVGVVNRMRSLIDDVPGISLALSLHAPNQALRLKIIPTAGAYPIPKLMDALKYYLEVRAKTTPKDVYVMIEYILLHGVNDMEEIAEELAVLLAPIGDKVKVNLIPYNPIFNAEGLAKTFKPPTEEDIERFRAVIQDRHGIFCTVRTEMGQDVNGACGQLACISEEAKTTTVDIEDLYRNRMNNELYSASGANRNKKHKPSRTVVAPPAGPAGAATAWARAAFASAAKAMPELTEARRTMALVGLGALAAAVAALALARRR